MNRPWRMKGAFQEVIRLSTGSRKVRLLYRQPLGSGRAGKAVVYRHMGHERAGEAVGLMSCDHNHVVIDRRELRNWEIIVKPGTNTSCVKLLL